MSGETAFELGETTGRRFEKSVISSLERIASQAGVRVADLGGSTGEYGRGVGGYANGMGRTGRGAGRPGSRSLGGGHEYHAAEPAYRGEKILGEDQALATPTAKDPGAAKESDVSATTRDPSNAARMSATEAATRDPNKAQSTRSVAGGTIDRSRFTEELNSKPWLRDIKAMETI